MKFSLVCVTVFFLSALSILSVAGSPQKKLNAIEGLHYFGKQNVKWSYECRNMQCFKVTVGNNATTVSLETCSFLCSSLQLWPQPRNVSIRSKNSSRFTRDRLFIRFTVPKEIEQDLLRAYNIFANNLPACTNCFYTRQTSDISISINVLQNDQKPRITTDESYSLEVSGTGPVVLVNITAPTYFGARHALETLTQVIWYDSSEKTLKIFHDLVIKDGPVFPHRGLMIDTARNYFPVSHLLKAIDGMASCKLNTLHLHLTDASSFPVILPNNPGFAEAGAYSSEKVYSPEDIKNLVEFARIRGIRVVLEVDAPSHVSAGWDQLPHNYGNVLICAKDDPFNGHLNPDNPIALELMKSIYEDLLDLGTDDEYFHLGADEVNTDCYADTKIVRKYKNVIALWADYVNNLTLALKSANRNKMPRHIVIWSSDLTNYYLNDTQFDENLVVQFWYGQIYPVLSHGAKVIYSTVGHWYLDCGYGPWKPSMGNAPCGPYTTWQTFYNHRPWNDYPDYYNQTLGGEACLWSETIVADSFEVRLWPRVAAMAERLWSDPESVDMNDLYSRISSHRERLIARNINCDAIWPEWCRENPDRCK